LRRAGSLCALRLHAGLSSVVPLGSPAERHRAKRPEMRRLVGAGAGGGGGHFAEADFVRDQVVADRLGVDDDAVADLQFLEAGGGAAFDEGRVGRNFDNLVLARLIRGGLRGDRDFRGGNRRNGANDVFFVAVCIGDSGQDKGHGDGDGSACEK